MESSNPAAETSAEVAVNFVRDAALVPEPKARIVTTDTHGRAPRNAGSRRIDFVDDGKLFEGHFTVQSTNLKSIIQYLLDRHNEQDIIIQDLQKQVHLLRSRSLKSKRRGGGDSEANGAGSNGPSFGVGSGATSEINKRLKRVEQFLQLWGVQLNDVAELVEEYGDPTITPEAYTSYLFDLPVFRLTRREARALMLNASQQTAANASAVAASDTATRRRNSSAKRDAVSSSAVAANAAAVSEEKAKSATPEKPNNKNNVVNTDSLAETTLEKATAALEKAEILLAELHSESPRLPPKSRRAESASKAFPSSGESAVDAEARAELDELGEYVMQRFEELEARSTMALAHSASLHHDQQNTPRRGGDESARGGEGSGKRNARPSPVPPPLPRANNASVGGRINDEVVDTVAREDAAASLELLEELEATMERRFKDLNSAIASISARTATLARNNSNNSNHSRGSNSGGVGADKSQLRTASPAAEDSLEGADSRTPTGNSHAKSQPSRKSATPSRKGRQNSDDASALIPVLPSAAAVATANLVDQTARDDTFALAKHVNELEEELLDRWQAMEERLRIIGRAAMKQGIINAASNGAGPQSVGRAPAVDRKAREDAALSLMRLQQVEKELGLLKRQYMAGCVVNDINKESRGAVPDRANQLALSAVTGSSEPSAPLRDTYRSKVTDLEKEVEQRMAEVNQAIAQLRGLDSATPLTLSPQKGGRDKATSPPVSPSTGTPPGTSVSTLPPALSQLTLRAADADVDTIPVSAAVTPVPPHDLDERRRTALQSKMGLDYNIDCDTKLFADFPRTSVRVGGRRTTISRLRSPDIPPFGSHLVQREVVDIPLVTAQKATGNDGAAGYASAAQRDAATAATPVHAARRVSNVNAGPLHQDGQMRSPSPQRSPKVASVVLQHA